MKSRAIKKVVAASLVSSVLTASFFVSADWLNPDPPEIVPLKIPYQGVLERDGELVDGSASFQVSLFAVEDGDDSAIWGPEEHRDIDVRDGRFSLTIGGGNPPGSGPLDYSHIEHPSLFLQIRVQTGDDTDYVTLDGRQQILSSPFAIRSYRAMYASEAETVTSLSAISQGTDDEITVSGSLSATCPPDTSRVGAWCITNEVGEKIYWKEAAENCHDRGMSICPLAALMTCDDIERDIASDCVEVTDSATWLWTNQICAREDVNAFESIQAFGPQGQDGPDEADCGNATGQTMRYYCCTMGPTTGL